MFVRLALLALTLFGFAGAARARDGLDARIGAEGVTVTENGRPVFFYRTRSANPGAEPARLNYIHPLYAPDGTVLTEDAPSDHPSQRGLFWAWSRVLLNGKPVANGEEMAGLTWHVRRTRFDFLPDGSGTLTVEADWIDHAGPELVFLANEATHVHVYPLDKSGARRLEFDVAISPKLSGLSVAGGDEPSGHGGFILRLIRPGALAFASDGLSVAPAAGAVSAGDSMGFAWTSAGPAWGIGLACRANGAPITRWVLRRGASAQNCVFPGARPYAIALGSMLDLQASLVIRPRRK